MIVSVQHDDCPDTSVETRKDFPIAEQMAFLDNAFIAPIPAPVRLAGQQWLDARATSETDVYAMLAAVEDSRRLFAGFIGADAAEIGFLYTTSEAENVVASALNLQPGDNIVTCDLAYPHATVLGKQLEKSRGVEMRVVRHSGGRIDAVDYARHLDARTRMVMIPWVSNINGFRHDLRAVAEIAHAFGALVVVDAIQIVGTEPLDVRHEQIDVLCSGTYKWLMCGWGVAPFYVRRELLDRLTPDRHGWQKALAAPRGDYQYVERETAAKFEYASPAFDQYQTLRVALRYLLDIGLDRIRLHSRRLLGDARRTLELNGFDIFTPPGNEAPNLSFWVGAAEKDVDVFFKARGVRVGFASGSRTSETYGANPEVCRVRISPAHYNNDADIRRFLDVATMLPRHSVRGQSES
jgi:selenocysteine lyase/cysteine desulfurase